KLMHYSTSQNCMGKWRNSITFVADDANNNLHMSNADYLATFVDSAYKIFNINKIYLAAYPQTPSPSGVRAPEVNALIDQSADLGTFVMNYSGHGGVTGWSQEAIFTNQDIDSWSNYDNMPFMINATCDFGRYDNPAVVSGGELVLTRSNGGAIGLIASTRVVYQYSNLALNTQIYNYIFKPMYTGQMPRLGDIIKPTKNNSLSGVNNRNYALQGDPSLRLAYPSQNAAVTSINNIAVTAVPDTLKALSKISIQGTIKSPANALLTDFSGKLNVTVFDKKSNITTPGGSGGPPFTFTIQNNALFEGLASVTNGTWTVSFIVPKDISYQYDFGKISLYAEKNATLVDAGGYYTNVIIGGTNPNAPIDVTPPTIKLYMNDLTFVYGGLVDANALFIANLSDASGINTSSSGIGHEIAAVLDGAETPLVLNNFYTANLNDYTTGSVRYPLTGLATGLHTIQLKAWDTYDNSAEAQLEFVVANNEKIALSHILNYPNPFSTHTVFHFDHNRAGEELNVLIQVYTVSGKLVKSLQTQVFASESHFSDLDWNGRDDFGDRLGRGVYVYRVWVSAPRDGSTVHKFEKLVILN
ncbi:MAG TPA: type IX secretion system sortase PorU, partial [Cytophagaceae bacterium]|nr:type IX secretion system sortase PorU [Cytophagaceae bacterium]